MIFYNFYYMKVRVLRKLLASNVGKEEEFPGVYHDENPHDNTFTAITKYFPSILT